MSGLRGVWNQFAGAFDKDFQKQLDKEPEIAKFKNSLAKDATFAETVELASVVGLITGVALTAVGIGCCAAGRFRVGAPLIFADVPLAFFSYNTYQASENFRQEVRENPMNLMVLNAKNQTVLLNHDALQKCLLQKTIGFESFVGLYTSLCIQTAARPQQNSLSETLTREVNR